MNASYTYNRRNTTAARYPNAADRSYFVTRFVDGFLCAASSAGIGAILFFLVTMC